MRRLVPWALITLALAGAGLGTGLGLAGTTASGTPGRAGSGAGAPALLQQVLAATRAAGSARFTYSSVTQSRDPLLRAAATGTGEVDFRNDDVALTVVEHLHRPSGTPSNARHGQPVTVATDEVRIGPSEYVRLSDPALPAPLRSRAPWLEVSNPSAPGALGGLEQTVTTLALGLFEPPFTGIHVVRLGQVAGGRTTEYALDAACPAAGGHAGLTVPRLSTDIWVDSSNRLVQAQSTVHLPPTAPRAAAFGGRPATTVSTLRFGEFGKPVRVVTPRVEPGYSSTVVEITTASC